MVKKESGDVVFFLADGFEECEGLLVVDLLRRTGLKTIMASIMGRREVQSSHEVLVHADCLAEDVDYDSADDCSSGRKDRDRESGAIRYCKRKMYGFCRG